MKVGIDLFSLVPEAGRGGGFHRYTTALVAALEKLDTPDEYVLFTNALNGSMFPNSRRMTQVTVRLPPRRAVWPFRLAWLHGVLPAMARRHGLDLVHCPMDTAPLRMSIPHVVTTNDLIADVYYPLHHPGSISALKTRYLFAAKRHSARTARAVICPSQATASDVISHYGVPSERITVVPDGVDMEQFTTARPARADATPYVLSVLSLSPHKNVGALIAAFSKARQRHQLPHELRLIGMAGTDASPVTQSIDAAIAAGVPIRYLGFVSDSALAEAYAGASLFVFLSLAEGFGLPPLEAMAAGVPVVASNASSVPEVCGDSALLVPPQDVDAAADAIGRVLTTPSLAETLAAAGRRRAATFSWAETARQTRAVYVRALEQGSSR